MSTISMTARELINFRAIFKHLFEFFVLQGVIYVVAESVFLSQLGY